MYKILLVDDEECILNSLYRCLRRNYNVIMAESGEEAMEVLQENQDIALILSDVKMPGMDGITFLAKANDISPLAVKMVLSGYAELDLVMDAINGGHVWRYMTKPWSQDDLLLAINNAIEYYEVKREKQLLLLELEQKNRQLAQWNSMLEKKVDANVRLKEKKIDLLMMLLNNPSEEEYMQAIIPLFGIVLQSTNICIKSTINDKLYGECQKTTCDLYEKCSNQVESAIDKKREIINDELCIIPIFNDDTIYGALIARDPAANLQAAKQDIDTLSSILKIAMQRECEQNALSH